MHYLIIICDLNTLLIETSFFYLSVTSPPARKMSGLCRWVKNCIRQSHRDSVISLKRNLCLKLWKFQLQRVWPLPLFRQCDPPRAEHFILFYSNIKDTSLFKGNYKAIKFVNVNVQKWYLRVISMCVYVWLRAIDYCLFSFTLLCIMPLRSYS